MFSQDVQHKTWKVINKMLKMMILTFTVDQRSKAKNRGNAATFFFFIDLGCSLERDWLRLYRWRSTFYFFLKQMMTIMFNLSHVSEGWGEKYFRNSSLGYGWIMNMKEIC